ALAPGLTPRAVFEKFAAVQMIDVHVPTTDGRELMLRRYTEPEPELTRLLDKLRLDLPLQSPPKITAQAHRPLPPRVVPTFQVPTQKYQQLRRSTPLQSAKLG
ncbi:MAG: hypothetical protein ACXW3X_11425, partial [Rhodoplanes sp.]